MIENMTRNLFLCRVFDYQNKQEWEYQDNLPCVIEFYDDACPPCRLTEPILRAVAHDFESRVRFYKVDTAVETTLARDLGINNLPTFVLCPVDDKPVVVLGAVKRDKLSSAIEKELLEKASSDGINSEEENN